MKSYTMIKDKQPELSECFFAFSNEQFTEGRKNAGLEGKKICALENIGLYGTRKGIKKLLADYDAIDREIAKNCDPQDVYDYEFDNHECSYTNDDEDAIGIVIRIFGTEKAKEVKRRFAYTDIK